MDNSNKKATKVNDYAQKQLEKVLAKRNAEKAKVEMEELKKKNRQKKATEMVI